MKKSTLLLLLSCYLALVSCKDNTSNKFRLGADLPFTGDVSYYGVSARNGIELAKEELLKDSSFPKVDIDIVYEDNQGQGKDAANAMSKLANVDKLPAVIGCGSSTETMAAAPIAGSTKTVLISPVSSAVAVSEAGPFIFRTCPSDLIQAYDLADWVKEKHFTRIAVIYVSSSWGTGFKENFVEHFKAGGGNILDIISTDPGESNFRTQIATLKSYNPEAYVFIIYAKEGGALVRQARELDIKNPIFGADPWSQQDFRTGAGKAAEGIAYTTPAQFDGPGFTTFRQAYLKKYNQEPDVYASNGYDCMLLLAKMYTRGARTGEEFQQSLGKVTDFQGATGTTHFDGNGDVVGKKFGRFTITNGNPEQIK